MAAPSSEERDVSADVTWTREMEEELKRVLLEYGNGLLKPGDSIEELLRKLDKLEHLLQHLMQDRKPLIETALKPAEEALISNSLMGHEEVDVKITAVSCITEIIRITAPKEPYNEDQMKDYFKLVNTAYGKLPSLAGRAYSKALSIIQTISSCHICVLMLDYELHDTVVEMFHLFLDGIQSNHPQEIPSSMEHIMVLMIQNAGDSEEFVLEAAKILLSALKKGNENVSPCAFQLARKVYEKCANDLKNYLPEAVRHTGVAVQEYDDVISSLHGTTQSDDMNAKEIGTEACGHGEVSGAGDLVLSNLMEKNCSDYTKVYGNINENNGTLPHSIEQNNRREIVLQEAKDKGIEACCHGEVNLAGDGGFSKLVENNDNDNLQDNENTNEYSEMKTHVGDQINQRESVLDRINSSSGPDVSRINSDILIDSCCLGEGNSSQGVTSAWMPFEQVSLIKRRDTTQNDDSSEKNNSTHTIMNGPPVEVGGTHHMQQELKRDNSPILKKRIRKPSSLIRAEEGYDSLWMLCECASVEDSHHRKNSRNKNTISKSSQLSSSPVREPMNVEMKPQEKSSQDKKDGTLGEDNGLFLLSTSVSKTMTSKDIVDEECIKETIEQRTGENVHSDGILKNPTIRKRSIVKVSPRKKVRCTNVVLEAATSKHSVEVKNLKEELRKVRDKSLPANSIGATSKNLEKGQGTSNKVDCAEKERIDEDLSGDILIKTLGFQSRNKSSQGESHYLDISNPQYEKISSKRKGKPSLAKKVPGETSKGKTVVSENLTGDIVVKTLAKTTSSKVTSLSEDISNLKRHRSNLPYKEKNHSKKRKHSLSKKAFGETSKGEIVYSEIQMGGNIAKASEVNDFRKNNDENLVGCKVKVWWPLDERYYEGKVASFDDLKKTHKVDYDDGETELLDLTKERWEVIDDYNLSTHEQRTVPPPPSAGAPRVASRRRRGKSSPSSETELKGLWKQILG